MIEKISLEALDEMVDYIGELGKLYKKNERRECLFNPIIFLKMLVLPFYDDKELKDKEKQIEELVSITPCPERLIIYKEQFLVFYKDWLKKHYPEIYGRVEKIKTFQLNDFFEIDREEVDVQIDKMQKGKIVDAKTFMEQNDIDEAIILKLIRSMKRMKEVSKKYSELTDEYVEELFHNDEFIRVFQFSIEFRDIAYTLELLKLKLLSLDLKKLSKQQRVILKTMMDGILSDLDDWIHQVLIDQTAKDIHYLDASLLANIAQMDVMLNSLEKNKEEEEDDFELF